MQIGTRATDGANADEKDFGGTNSYKSPGAGRRRGLESGAAVDERRQVLI